MPTKRQRPDSNARLKRGKTDEEVIFFRVHKNIKDAIRAAAEHESAVRGHTVSVNEWVTRAAIDRIGEVLGVALARRFYQQFFNGIAAISMDTPIEAPTVGDGSTNGDTNN